MIVSYASRVTGRIVMPLKVETQENEFYSLFDREDRLNR